MNRITRWSQFMACCCASAVWGPLALAQIPNNTWDTSTLLSPGVRTVDDMVFSVGTGGFNTTIGAFGNRPTPALVDDNSSPLGNGLASGLFGVPVGSRSTIRVGVSGFPDFDFDGFFDGSTDFPHNQSGDYDIQINVFNSGGELIEEIFESDMLEPGEVDFFEFSNSEWLGGRYDAFIDNGEGDLGNQSAVDFFTFTGLPAGVPYIAEVTSAGFDTVLGRFNDNGALIDVDDDGGIGLLSRLEGFAPVSGQLHLAVSAFADFEFIGNHFESGSYRLELTVIPEPAAIALAMTGLLAALRLRRCCSRPSRRAA